MSPTSTSDDDAIRSRRLARWWRGLPLGVATFDLLVYFVATLLLTLLVAIPLVVHYQRAQDYGPQRVQLTFQPCDVAQWKETAVKAVLQREGELQAAYADNGTAITKFMPVLMLPHEAEGAHEPAVLGYFELHPHTGVRPHIDGPALEAAAGCPVTQIRITPVASVLDAQQPLTRRLATPLTIIALTAGGISALLAYWLRARRLPRLPGPLPLRRALPLAIVTGIALQGVATTLLLSLRASGLELSPSNLAPLVALWRDLPWVAVLLVVVVAPLGEELFFRHVLLRRFALAGRPLAGLLLSAGIFAVLHELSPREGTALAHLAMTGIYLALGLALGGLYLYTRRLSAVVLAHLVGNAIALALLAYSAS